MHVTKLFRDNARETVRQTEHACDKTFYQRHSLQGVREERDVQRIQKSQKILIRESQKIRNFLGKELDLSYKKLRKEKKISSTSGKNQKFPLKNIKISKTKRVTTNLCSVDFVFSHPKYNESHALVKLFI